MHKPTKYLHTYGKYSIFFVLFALCFIFCSNPLTSYAYTEPLWNRTEILNYKNESTNYEVLLDDSAKLLSKSEENQLLEDMKPITKYGNVIFVSIDENDSSTSYFAQSYYEQHFGYESGTLFVIDMDNREIYIHNKGEISETITNGVSLTITDNVYTYASKKEYYTCASMAFSQILRKLDGLNIPEPMKYTCNGLLALLLSLLLNYILVKTTSKAKKAKDEDLLSNLSKHCFITNTYVHFTHQTRKYSPRESSSSSGGGGGGGGSSSSGGGHSF